MNSYLKRIMKAASNLLTNPTNEERLYLDLRNHNANINNRFRFLVDDFLANGNDPKFYGKWAYRLIIQETVSPYIIYSSEEYLKEKNVLDNPKFNLDDYHFHKGFIDLTLKNYEGFIYHLDQMSNSSLNARTLLQFNAANKMMRKSIDNYSNTFFNSPYTQRDLSVVHNNNLNLKEYLFSLVKLQAIVHYWSNITADMPYMECSSALSLVARTFENQLKNLTLRHNAGYSGNSIGNMQNSLNQIFSGFSQGQRYANVSSYSTPIALSSNWMTVKTTLTNWNINAAANKDFYTGMIFEVCRVIRNNSQHAIDFSNKSFSTSDQFREYVDVLLEGILLTLQY